jgi:hypothetical protein
MGLHTLLYKNTCIILRIKSGKTCICISSENFQEKWGKENAAIYVKNLKIERIKAHLERQPVTISL